VLELAPYLPGFLAAYAILLVAALSPGPAVAMLIGIATGQGRTPALAATLGIAFGSMSINILTMLGVGLFLSQAAWAMSALRITGALYLVYLAYGAFGKAIRPPPLQAVAAGSRALSRLFLVGYLLQVTNPKAIAFWLAIASIGATKGASIFVVLLFIAGAFLISFVCHAAWAVTLSVDAIRSTYIAWRRWIEATLGSFFVFAAYRLAVSDD
jgi:threonine/homoserine/homoserine lactone efflux protein